MPKFMKRFKEKHGNLYEFIMFNLFSNIATIINFIILNLGNLFFFQSFSQINFKIWIFDYSIENGGLSAFLSFLLSYACAQTVNFIVQRKLVFNSNNKLGKSIFIYFLTIIVVYLICLYIPTIVMAPLARAMGETLAANITNIINILIQVAINYPVMKFVIMRKANSSKE